MDVKDTASGMGISEWITFAALAYVVLHLVMENTSFVFVTLGNIIYMVFILMLGVMLLSLLVGMIENAYHQFIELDRSKKKQIGLVLSGLIGSIYVFVHLYTLQIGEFWYLENQVIAYFKYDFPAMPDFLSVILDILWSILKVLLP